MAHISLKIHTGLTVKKKEKKWLAQCGLGFSNRKHLENSSRWLMDLKVSLGTVLDFTNSADQRGRNKRKEGKGGREGRKKRERRRKKEQERERKDRE